jgi:hypothetical protein
MTKIGFGVVLTFLAGFFFISSAEDPFIQDVEFEGLIIDLSVTNLSF